MLTFCPMDEPHARFILGWQYEPPYDVYNPGAGDVEETLHVFLDPQYAYYAILDAAGELVAYCCFGADARVPGGGYSAEALDVGLGIRPDRTGQGQGGTFVEAVLDFARRTLSPDAFRVTIAAFNVRAQRVWEKQGFRRVQRFDSAHNGRSFLVLIREEPRAGGRAEQGDIRDGPL